MDLVSTKVIVAVVFAFLRLFFGLLPFKIYKCLKLWEKEDEGAPFINEKRHKQVNCYLALFQSFGGGVLFATCFLHMMPDVNKSVEHLIKNTDFDATYPFSQVIVSIGFFFIYFIEEVSHWLITKMGKETRRSIKNNCQTQCICSRPISSKENKIYPQESGRENNDVVFIIQPIDTNVNVERENQKNLQPKKEDEDKADFLEDDYELNPSRKNSTFIDEDMGEVATLEEVEQVKELEKLMERQEKDQQQILRCCLVVVALSLHAFFEGLAIGLQLSISNIWYLFTAISIHSATILFCIGLELLIARTKASVIIFNIVILSVTSPFGVLLGLVITLYADMNTTAKSLAVVLLEGLSAGTILYITFFEVLNREKARRVIILTRACFILGGFTLMAILEYVELGK
ncbi:zinc/iron transporter [Holotrichia oblita]|uniref:Zinc/iron transporter n=2 Tax=Holotrichia oblita TaxID=644536 RepID=A0ACB9TL24_HOLOL|nr:zinc/iron transporter [Holotrichia oblita]